MADVPNPFASVPQHPGMLKALRDANARQGFQGVPSPISPFATTLLQLLSLPAKALTDFREQSLTRKRELGFPADQPIPLPGTATPGSGQGAAMNLFGAVLKHLMENYQDINMRPFPGSNTTVVKIPQNMRQGWNYQGIPLGQKE